MHVDTPVNADCAKQYKDNPEEYFKKVKEYTATYAK